MSRNRCEMSTRRRETALFRGIYTLTGQGRARRTDLMARQIRKVVVLGANGAMGAGSGEVFAAAGIETTFLARSKDKALEGQKRAEKLAKSTAVGRFIKVGSYDADLARAVAEADLIFEAVSEDLALKRVYFADIDKHRRA